MRKITGLIRGRAGRGIYVATSQAAARAVDCVRAALSRPMVGLQCEKCGREPGLDEVARIRVYVNASRGRHHNGARDFGPGDSA